ncbi:MAG: NAD(P)H-dependent oxidoreductase [Bacteroidetes bacterium]|nr:NAD(P)H-dependent oxidoreductase [Bacteroidota bacterium]MBU1114432.1 NAD(P)H-dependent oxidoreductase [Bacteroidota bacterium]MBU1800528.1 NAD(P)H-dependent oxidoreductase [Bacteroidota bacterium]
MKDNKYKIVAIIGSVSKNSYTRKSLKLAVNEIEKHDNFSVTIIDPRDFDLPNPGSGIMNEDRKRLQQIVGEADGAILATPEYNGSYSSVIKLVIENLGYPSQLCGKPITLLGIADGEMGAIKSIEALRGVCAHIGGLVLPHTTSISYVNQKFDVNDNCIDEQTDRRIRRVGTELIKYINQYIDKS